MHTTNTYAYNSVTQENNTKIKLSTNSNKQSVNNWS